jgi:hypothetical protein
MHSRWTSQNKNTGSHQLNDLQLVKQTASNCRELCATFDCVPIIIMIAIPLWLFGAWVVLLQHLALRLQELGAILSETFLSKQQQIGRF